jgi:hypothetical protein
MGCAFEMNFRDRIEEIPLAAVASMLGWLIVSFLRTTLG